MKPADPLDAPEVVEVLEHWRSRSYHTRKPQDLPDRRKRIAARIAEGFDASTLKAAVDGASLDPWLMGTDARSPGKRYLGVETILRDATQVERLAGLWDVAVAEERERPDQPWVPPPPPPRTPEEQRELEEAKAEALEKLRIATEAFTPRPPQDLTPEQVERVLADERPEVRATMLAHRERRLLAEKQAQEAARPQRARIH